MANNGKSVKGTKYNRAGCAALNTWKKQYISYQIQQDKVF